MTDCFANTERLAMTAKSKALLFFLVFLGGAFLRFHTLDRQSLWDDELSTIRTISSSAPQMIQRLETYETHPPLYFIQLKIWRALHGRSLVRLRANSALWGSLSLGLMFLLGRRYGGEPLGLLAMALLAVSPFHLAYSQELRSYAMAISIALAAWLNLEGVISNERKGLPLQVLLWTAQMYTHYWGIFVVLAQMTYGLWRAPREDRMKILAAGGVAGVFFSLWLPVLFQQMNVVDRLVFWASPFSIKSLAKVFLAFSGLYFNMASSVFYLPSTVGGFVGTGLVFAAALGLGFWRGPKMAVVWLVVGLGVPWILSAWKPTIFLWYRYTVHMLPAFAILVAAGLLAIRPRALGVCLVLVALGSQVWGDWTYFHGWQKANPKAVVAYVHRIRQSDSIVVRPSYFGELFNFYDLGTSRVIDEHLLDSPDKRVALRGHHAIFLEFDVPSDPVGDAIVGECNPVSATYFPGIAHLGVTVYELE
jgi:hypothetical protein